MRMFEPHLQWGLSWFNYLDYLPQRLVIEIVCVCVCVYVSENLRLMKENKRSRVLSEVVIANKNQSNIVAKVQLEESRQDQGR